MRLSGYPYLYRNPPVIEEYAYASQQLPDGDGTLGIPADPRITPLRD